MKPHRVIGLVALLLAIIGSAFLTAAPAQAVGCWGDWCSGQDPQGTHCSDDAFTLAADESYGTGAYVELRYSQTCKTEWARVPRSHWTPGDTMGIVQDTGYSQGLSSGDEYWVWSRMIYSPKRFCRAWWNDYGWDYAQTAWA